MYLSVNRSLQSMRGCPACRVRWSSTPMLRFEDDEQLPLAR